MALRKTQEGSHLPLLHGEKSLQLYFACLDSCLGPPPHLAPNSVRCSLLAVCCPSLSEVIFVLLDLLCSYFPTAANNNTLQVFVCADGLLLRKKSLWNFISVFFFFSPPPDTLGPQGHRSAWWGLVGNTCPPVQPRCRSH